MERQAMIKPNCVQFNLRIAISRRMFSNIPNDIHVCVCVCVCMCVCVEGVESLSNNSANVGFDVSI